VRNQSGRAPPWCDWSVLALALASAALGAVFGVLNHFEPAGSSAFWFNLVIPLAFSVPGENEQDQAAHGRLLQGGQLDCGEG
jgi:hypothetical protein